jgi:hypothetical protein
MFKRLLLDDSATIYVLVAFVTAATIFVTITWRALRMPRTQVDHFANLPFTPDTDAGRHDTHA